MASEFLFSFGTTHIQLEYSRCGLIMALYNCREIVDGDECLYKKFNGLAQVPFEGVLIEAYKGTRRKHNMKCRQIGHTTI